jgi:hypothetical protein
MLPDVGTHQAEGNGPRGNASAVQGLELLYPLVIGVRHKAAANVCVRVCVRVRDCVHVRVQVGSCVHHESPSTNEMKSRMVLAFPGPLLTPHPSSSPPKSPIRSYSAQIRSQNEEKNHPPTTYLHTDEN